MLLLLLWLGTSAQANSISPEACIEKLRAGQSQGYRLPGKGLRRLYASMGRREIKQKTHALFIDYTRSSAQRRAFLLDLKMCEIVRAGHTLHGGKEPSPSPIQDGDPNHDGYLDACVNRYGTRQFMTRPGAYVTGGCRSTRLQGWPALTNDPRCTGVGLIGLESTNQGTDEAGVKLHEHTYLRDEDYIKPLGQGCPAFAPGVLKPMLGYGILRGALVYAYAPQCDGEKASRSAPAPAESETELP